MKKVVILLLILIAIFTFIACSPNAVSDEERAIKQFETVLIAVNADTDGYYSEIKRGTDAYAAIVDIEKIYRDNRDNVIVKQIFCCCEMISFVRRFGDENSYDMAFYFARQIDRSYTGPYASEIIALARKYVADSEQNNAKSAFTMSVDEMSDLKWWIEERYDYYDRVEGRYTGDKSTELIFQEAAYAYEIEKYDVDFIWADSLILARKSKNTYRKANTDPDKPILRNDEEAQDDSETEYTLFRVGVSADWPPFQYIDDNGDLKGFEVELAELFAAYNDCEVQFVLAESFDALLPGLDTNKYDLVMSGMDFSDGRAIQYGYSDPYFQYDLGGYTENIVAYTRKNAMKLINMINRAIVAVKTGDQYAALKIKYEVEALDGRFSD